MSAARRWFKLSKHKHSVKQIYSPMIPSQWCCQIRAGYGLQKDTKLIQKNSAIVAAIVLLKQRVVEPTKPLVFIDSNGRGYNLAPHTLPSARSQGEPLTGKFKPPPGSRFVGVLIGGVDTRVLMASNAGFGFVGRLGEMVTKNRAGKAVLSVPSGGLALPPVIIEDEADSPGALWVASVTNQGRMLVFPLQELPELGRGKGNKLINVPTPAFKSGEEVMLAAVVLAEDKELVVHAGQRHLRLKHRDLQNYIGERARRGRKLPRGFQKVDRLSVS